MSPRPSFELRSFHSFRHRSRRPRPETRAAPAYLHHCRHKGKSCDAAWTERAIGIPPPINGSIFRVVEYAPDASVQAMPKQERDWTIAGAGAESGGDAIQTAHGARHHGMHRTKSVDYAIVLSGEIWLMLDDSETLLRAGDVVVQQATWHAWSNRGSEPCRIAFVLIGAQTPWE